MNTGNENRDKSHDKDYNKNHDKGYNKNHNKDHYKNSQLPGGNGLLLILASVRDRAAVNIRDHLLSLWSPHRIGEFEDMPVYRKDSTVLASIHGPALEMDNPHRKIAKVMEMGETEFSGIIYLSRHQSESRRRTLSVHPIGNYGEAKFGGRPHTLVPSTPHLMTAALRFLCNHRIEGFDCTFEATHHGPYNDLPTFFIEIGSTETEWSDPKAGEAVAMAVLDTIRAREEGQIPSGRVCIGLGGGHYAPRHTKFALREGLNFGHMMPAYAVENLNREMAEEMVRRRRAWKRCVCTGRH